jgi:tetratricopeptide (TPR) repeat protein
LRALDLNPRYVQNLAWYSNFYLVLARGRLDEGIAVAKKAVEIDPLSGYVHTSLAIIYHVAGKAEEAVQSASAAVELGPSFHTYWILGMVQYGKGEYANSLAAAEMALALSGRHALAVTGLAVTYAAMGKMAEAKATYAELSARAAHEYVQPFYLALAASAVGETNKAFGYLYEAIEIRDPALIAAKYGPAPLLREDPHFDDILAQMRWK